LKSKPLLEVLVRRFPDSSRDLLYARVLCGEVFVAGECIRNPKAQIQETALVEFTERPYVSRGGLKLDGALAHMDFHARGKVILDVGASTGGFTDCLLQHGAAHVHTVDVGANQLAYSLRIDPRVSVHENTNIMTVGDLEPKPDLATVDLSFRSVRRAAARVLDMCVDKRAMVLVKPQFELQEPSRDFDGVLRDPDRVLQVLLDVANALCQEGVYVEDVVASPISGRKGNREFFFLLCRRKNMGTADFCDRVKRELGLPL
jgi:23S rRNA (cytidine1920-2'-O)/16S rRNA (cytidine1409-2'-O)-methyltransferase